MRSQKFGTIAIAVAFTSFLWVLAVLLAPSARAQQVEWEIVARADNTIMQGLDCADDRDCAVVGAEGSGYMILLRTLDAGSTWTRTTVPAPRLSARAASISHPTAEVFVIGADSGVIWVSTDGASSFRRTQVPQIASINSITMVDALHGIAALGLHAYVTSDCWITYAKLALPDSLDGRSISVMAVSPDGYVWASVYKRFEPHMVLVGTRGEPGDLIVLSPITVMPSIHITGEWFMSGTGRVILDSSTGLVRSFVEVSEDHGRTWRRVLDTINFTGRQLLDIAFSDRSFGVAGGIGGAVWSTTNGGQTWQTDTINDVPSGEATFFAIHCFSNHVCLAAMRSNVITRRKPLAAPVLQEQALSPDVRMKVVPNPASASIRIVVDGTAPAGACLSVTDAIGRNVPLEASRRDHHGGTVWLASVSELPSGFYRVVIDDTRRTGCLLLIVR